MDARPRILREASVVVDCWPHIKVNRKVWAKGGSKPRKLSSGGFRWFLGKHRSASAGQKLFGFGWANTVRLRLGKHRSASAGQTPFGFGWANTVRLRLGKHRSASAGQTPFGFGWANTVRLRLGKHRSASAGQKMGSFFCSVVLALTS